MTIIGKVKNINQMEAKNDFLISAKEITFASLKGLRISNILMTEFHKPRISTNFHEMGSDHNSRV
jgi:hypothetical protein